MKRTLLVAVFTVAFSGSALAFHCPVDMKDIDAALGANPQLSAEQLAQVKKLRAAGEAQHKDGKHAEAVETLGQAKEILGIK